MSDTRSYACMGDQAAQSNVEVPEGHGRVVWGLELDPPQQLNQFASSRTQMSSDKPHLVRDKPSVVWSALAFQTDP